MKCILFASLLFCAFYSSGDNQPDSLELTKADTILSMAPLDSLESATQESYFIWDQNAVNPYKIDVLARTDTVSVFLDSGICHYHKPLDSFVINSDFGFRRYRYHYGVDLDLETGDPVYAAFDGIVRIAKYYGAFGNCVVLAHNNGFETVYGHLSSIAVGVGDTVESGELIGLGGSTGRATGPHLHFECRFLGQPIDPHVLIDFETGNVKQKILPVSRNTFGYLIELRKIKYYTVRPGDSLWKISRKYGVPISKLCRLNHISRNAIIRVGQRIRYQ